MVFFFFLLFSLLLSFTQTGTIEAKKNPIYLAEVNTDDALLFKSIKDYLTGIGYELYDLKAYDTSPDELLELMEIDAAIETAPNLKERLLAKEAVFTVEAQAQNMNTARIYSELHAFSNLASALLEANHGEFNTETAKELKQALEVKAKVIHLEESKSSVLKKHLNFFRSTIPYVLSYALITLFSYIYFDLEDKRVKRRCLLAAVSPREWNLGIFAGQLLIALFFTAITILIGAFSLKSEGATLIASLIPATCVLSFTTCSLSNLLCRLIPKTVISGAALVYALGLAFISGGFYPREILGDGVIAFSKLFPLYYYINLVDGLGNQEKNYLLNLLIIAAFGIFYLLLSFSLDRIHAQRNDLSKDLGIISQS